jgi:hypothetical protein
MSKPQYRYKRPTGIDRTNIKNSQTKSRPLARERPGRAVFRLGKRTAISSWSHHATSFRRLPEKKVKEAKLFCNRNLTACDVQAPIKSCSKHISDLVVSSSFKSSNSRHALILDSNSYVKSSFSSFLFEPLFSI